MVLSTLKDLLVGKTKAEFMADYKEEAEDRSLPYSSWSISSVPYMLMAGFARACVSFSELIKKVAAGSQLSEATGDWLDLLAFNQYSEYRIKAEFTEGVFVFTDTANAGPFTLAANSIWVTTASGLLYTNSTGGTLTVGGSLSLSMKAEKSGVLYNIGVDSELQLVTSLAGVVVTNPALEGSDTWITVQGLDQEKDATFRERCRNKWPASGLGMNAEAWDYHARLASSNVTKVKVVTNPGGVAGRTGIYIAGPTGVVDSGTVTTVNNALQPKKTVCTTVVVTAATAETVSVEGTVYIDSAFEDSVLEDIELKLAELASGLDLDPVIYKSRLIALIQNVAGVEYVILTEPTEEVVTVTGYKVVSFDSSGLDLEVAE